MKYFLSILRYRWRRLRYPPIVEISHSGQLTARPQVHVSACGMRGSQTVYSWNADSQGEASATLFGRGLADILQRRLVDRRQHTELFVQCYEKRVASEAKEMANPVPVIELDCAPGGIRPGDLIAQVVKGTILEDMPDAHPDATCARLFGHWTWKFPTVTPEQWADVQKVIEPRIRALYAAGTIRFGSWG